MPENALIDMIHHVIKQLCDQKEVRSLASCFKQNIKTALHRFAALGLITKKITLNQASQDSSEGANGSQTTQFIGLGFLEFAYKSKLFEQYAGEIHQIQGNRGLLEKENLRKKVFKLSRDYLNPKKKDLFRSKQDYLIDLTEVQTDQKKLLTLAYYSDSLLSQGVVYDSFLVKCHTYSKTVNQKIVEMERYTSIRDRLTDLIVDDIEVWENPAMDYEKMLFWVS